RMPCQRVDVALRSGTVVVPRLAAVGRAHEPAELDPDEQKVSVVRARCDPAHVRCPGSRRETPRRAGRELEQACELHPGLPAVIAPVERTRLGAGIDRTVRRADGKREDAGRWEPAVAPGFSAV